MIDELRVADVITVVADYSEQTFGGANLEVMNPQVTWLAGDTTVSFC